MELLSGKDFGLRFTLISLRCCTRPQISLSFGFAWIGLLGTAFTVPDQCRAQQSPSAGRDILRLPIVEGRDIWFRRLSNPQNLSHVRVESIVQDTQGFMWFVPGM